MKKIGKMLLLATLMILLVGVVCAAEVSDNTTSTADDVTEAVDDSQIVSLEDTMTDEIQADESLTKTIKKNNAKDLSTKKESTLTANSWETFVTAFNEAKTKTENTTIFLEEGTYINNGTLTWDNSNIVLNIDGNGQTIDGNQSQVFGINRGCSLVLKNITITNGLTINGGAIENYGTLTVTYSTLNNNKANDWGGAIDNNNGEYFDIIGCNFTKNHATERGGAIFSSGFLNASGNNFIENTAGNKETIDLFGFWNGLFNDNHYYSTNIGLNEIKLSVKDDKQSFKYGENVELEFNLQPTSINYYFDFADGINDITLYINDKKKCYGQIRKLHLKRFKTWRI
ncbi:MAG: hypothetical protein BZ135_05195 [Methanosphaera sp. rholeuAM6]|nr:MAG: hypothetical protein BZ135_05195 [Methanosphaera sp. rholeuAM6]